MTEIDSHRAPQANVRDVEDMAQTTLAQEPHAVDAGRGLGWLAEGFDLFRRAPLIWVAIVVITMIIFIALGLIPIAGFLATPLLWTVLAGGLMLGCRALERGEELTLGHLFAGFQRHTSPLVVIGALYLVGLLVLMLIGAMLSGGAILAAMTGGPAAVTALSGIALIVLIVLALSIPLAMAVWFAPALASLNDVAPVEAMRLSFRGCLRNVLPFLVFGVVTLLLGVIASIPLALGWLILLPVLIGATYAAYRDIFLERSAGV